MLSPELIEKVNQIFIRSRHKVTDIFTGEFESAFRGQGIEFEEFREYTPGDDVRQIAWNVTARMDKPYVKLFREEREQTIFFLIDLSKSQDFGRSRTKHDVMTEIAALLSYATIKTNDKVGLIIFTDKIEKYIPPKKGRAHVWHLIATLLGHEPQSSGTNISEALKFFMTVANRKTTCFLISDFWDQGYETALGLVGYKHDLIVMRILEEVEKKLPKGVLVDFIDKETGEIHKIDLSKTKQIQKINRSLKKRDDELKYFFRSRGIDALDLMVGEDYTEALLQFFLRREKKR